MSFETTLADLADPAKRPTSQQLVDFSNLDAAEVAALEEVWGEIEPLRRYRLVHDLADMTQDNVELNFDAVHKLALRDEVPEVRRAALAGLYEYEGRDLINPLATALREDPDVDVRREAAIGLGRYALAGELGYLREGDISTVREALIESTEDLEEDERVRARAIEALGALSGDETDNLIESIYHEDSLWLKVGAVDSMGRSANEIWLPLVLRELQNPAPEMRHAAAFAAGEIGEEEAVPALRHMARSDPDHEVQTVAVRAIGAIGGVQARVALKSLLYEGDDDLRETIQETMTEMLEEEDPLSPPGLR